ncbi:MAG: SIR2 family protein [Opitutales bacterium]
MRLCFLLGSGISRPAKLPSVDEITEQVLAPNEFFRCSDGVFRRASVVQQSPEIIQMQMPDLEKIKRLLCWLKGHAEIRYAADPQRSVNYEDLAYLAAQIHDDASDEYENPAIGPLVCCALNSLPDMCSAGKLGEQAGEVENFIADVVTDMLCKPASQTDHLRLFREAASDSQFQELNVFTLNHDCLLERYLRDNGVAVVDGFDPDNSLGIRIWNPVLFDCLSTHTKDPVVRLFKLHGSINWRRFRPREGQNEEPSGNPWREEYIGIRSNRELASVKDAEGRIHEELDRALFLAGTFNKMFSYLNHVFLELHYRFHRALAEATRLVVSGYGFGDKGINNRIKDWMCSACPSGERKMILIEPRSLDDLQQTARGAIAGKLMAWQQAGRLIHLKCGIGSTDADWKIISNELKPE